MDEAIKNFGKQFDFVPQIENKENLRPTKKIVICGMGGSHLAADIMQTVNPKANIIVHCDYGLPQNVLDDRDETLVIGSSYSGNTEETIDALNLALESGMHAAVIAVGGKLLEMAKSKRLPYIEMPDTGIQPRSALGYSLVSLAHLSGDAIVLLEIEKVKGKISGESLEDAGQTLSKSVKGKVPIIYSSRRNASIAYNWKIKFNETGKIPAFFNVFPELNHNEMTGFDLNETTAALAKPFLVIFLKDDADDGRVQKRMDICRGLYQSKGIATIEFEMKGGNILEKIFSSLLSADWAAYHVAVANGAEPEQVPLVEEFKRLMK